MINTQFGMAALPGKRPERGGREVAISGAGCGQVSGTEMLHSWRSFVSYWVEKMPWTLSTHPWLPPERSFVCCSSLTKPKLSIPSLDNLASDSGPHGEVSVFWTYLGEKLSCLTFQPLLLLGAEAVGFGVTESGAQFLVGIFPELSFWALNSWLLNELICTVGIARVRKDVVIGGDKDW